MISRREQDLLTPHKISVVLLIEKYGSRRPKFWGAENDNDLSLFCNTTPKYSALERKSIFILVSKLIQGSDLSLSDLLELIESSDIPSTLATSFTRDLQQMYKNGIETLLTLFDSVEKFCNQDQSRVDSFPCLWTSLVGLHLRQLNLAFRRLGFSHVVSLYQKFCNYYCECYKNRPSMLEEPSICKSMSEYEEMKLPNETDDNDVDMDQTSCSNELLGLTSSADRKSNEPLGLRFSLPPQSKSIFKSEQPSLLKIGTRHQAELFIQEQVSLLLQQDPSAMPPAQLQQVLSVMLKNCPDLGKGHFLSYLNCLRVREQTGAIHSLVRAYDSKLMNKEAGRGEDITRTFRYAALNMAALQAQFEHRELGLMALEESIRLAQESNDDVCLQYALAWLYSLSPSQKASLMKRSHTRSGEMNLSYLSWLSLLNYTMELSKSKIPPSQLLKKLLGSSSANQNRNALEGGLAGQAGLWGVQAGLWAIWGNLPLTAVCSQLVLHMTPQMMGSIHAPSTASPNCAAICNMALILANLGEFNLSGELLQHAQTCFPAPWEHSKLWMITQCFITFYELLRQGLWSQAKSVAINMATVQPVYSRLLEAELCVSRGEFSQALQITADLKQSKLDISICEDLCADATDDPEVLIKTILTEAEALAGGNNLGAALSVLVKGVTIAQEYHMAYLAALGNLQLSCVQMHLGLLKEANCSLEKGLDVILSGGGLYDQARARLLQAKLEVCLADKANNSDALFSAAQILEDVQKQFSRVKAFQREKETIYLKARLYHSCGKIEERNRSALEFRQLEQHQPCQTVVANTCVF